MAILGILAALVLVVINPFKRLAQARDSQRKSDLGVLARTLDNYYLEHQTYPDPGADLFSESIDGEDWIPGIAPDYLKKLPSDPKQAGIVGILANVVNLFQEKAKLSDYRQSGKVAAVTSEMPLQTKYSPPYSGPFTVEYTMGYRFSPSVSGQITQLWCYNDSTKNVRLYSDTGTLLASVDINCNGVWGFADITPVNVSASTYYRVALYTTAAGSYYRRQSSAPVTSGNVYIESGVYMSGNAFPVNSSTSVYGLVDITFTTWTPDPTPTPTPLPSPSPTPTPSPSPSPSPTPAPSPSPTPTAEPSAEPSIPPDPSPSLSPSASPEPGAPVSYKYRYQVTDSNRQSFILWAYLENEDDAEIYTKTSTAKCQETPPSEDYNYCVKR